jgi:type IV secretion system protein VirD4
MQPNQNRTDDLAVYAVAGGVLLVGLLWVGGVASAFVCGHPVPHRHAVGAVLTFAHVGDPSAAWHAPVGPAVVYWTFTAVVLAVGVSLMLLARRVLLSVGATQSASPVQGLASRREVKRAAGGRHLVRRGSTLRPALEEPSCRDLGYRLGRSRGVECWASVEDSLILLGPPRSGKGLHTVIPAILDAPGAVITTSTRPDNLAATLRARSRFGPVAVFDPQGLAAVPSALRWSPIRGCEVPQTAMARARALCTDPSQGMENASFWSQQCYTAVRCLLHAAALDRRTPVELYRWSLSPIAAQDAIDVLATDPKAAAAWDGALEAILSADPRQRDSTWSMVSNVFAPLADPMVLDAISPAEGEQFDPVRFLHSRGTLYLLGTASGASATSSLVTAFVEDVVETARHLAAASPGARLDPPLAVILDEAANYPLPSLPSLMSEGGGTGITTMVVLQSLAQARARWGQDGAGAIWDAAIVKLILGGSGNANDLRDLTALIGTRQERRTNESWGPDGRKSVSTSTQEMPILDTGRLRTLPFGSGVLLLRSAPPTLLELQAWTARPDAAELKAGRAAVEATLRGPQAQRT